MTKNILKRSFSIFAVVMVLMSTLIVPAFAADTGDTSNCSSTSAGGKEVCTILSKMYKDMKYSSVKTDDYPYAISISTASGITKDYYLPQRPDVNNVTVQINKDGQLQVFGMGNGDANTWNQFFAKYKSVIVGISGIGAITFIALFIMQFMKLGASAGNPQARSQALTGCLWTGIAAAALGAVSIIAGFFYNAV